MEHLRGGNLHRRLLKNGKFTNTDARTCIAQLVKSVRQCHEALYLHRDICLENLVIADPDVGLESLRLIDFGEAA